MEVGIRFSDNDFQGPIRMFLKLFILPTFVEREEGHFVTHLTTFQVVEMFNLYCAHCYKWVREDDPYYHSSEKIDVKRFQEYLKITESNVYWDGQIDKAIEKWGSDDIYCTDGKSVYRSATSKQQAINNL